MSEQKYVGLFTGLLFLIIGVTLLTAFAPTVSDSVGTDVGVNTTVSGSTCNSTVGDPLCGVSTTAKTVYGFTDLVWAGGSIVFIIMGIFSLAMTAKGYIHK